MTVAALRATAKLALQDCVTKQGLPTLHQLSTNKIKSIKTKFVDLAFGYLNLFL